MYYNLCLVLSRPEQYDLLSLPHIHRNITFVSRREKSRDCKFVRKHVYVNFYKIFRNFFYVNMLINIVTMYTVSHIHTSISYVYCYLKIEIM